MKKITSVMKWPQLLLLVGALYLFSVTDAMGQTSSSPSTPTFTPYTHTSIGNPYLPLWEHIPDGEPRVFEDPDRPGKLRAYIIGSHDLAFRAYCGPDIRAWSAPVEDLSSWTDEGPIFTYQLNNQWDVMYAPDLVEVKLKNGKKEYYLYPHSRGPGREAMVCKSSRPDGPFVPLNLTADGRGTIQGSTFGFDPSVYVEQISDPKDPDFNIGFRAYGFWGFQRSSAAQIDQKTMYSVRPGTSVIPYFIPASSRYGVVRDPAGTTYPSLLPGEDLGSYNFFEAASIRKVGNKFVFVFSGYSGPEYGLGSTNSALRYAYGDTPFGPLKAGGVLVDSRSVVVNQDGSALTTGYGGHNTHGSLQQINDQWYVFYHRPPRGFGYARQAMVAPVIITWDEKKVSEGGKVVIRGYDPYAANKIWTAKDSKGMEYTGGEVTSEGFHIFGLDPYQYYSAGYACFLSNTNSQQDSWDIWDNNMPITNVKNSDIIGYKYFGFGGLAKAQKGLKPFEGVKSGNKTAFNVFITPKTSAAFKVNVWMDSPYNNAVWKGVKLGTISVPAGAAQVTTQFTLDVSAIVDKLDKKHAIYLVAEGGSDNLFDLIGLGFSSAKKKIVRPIPPTVSIKVNGVDLVIPTIPVRSTNANGLVSYDMYEIKYPVPATVTGIPVISATASDKSVKIVLKQADSNTGTAMATFTYNGVPKNYRVVYTAQ